MDKIDRHHVVTLPGPIQPARPRTPIGGVGPPQGSTRPKPVRCTALAAACKGRQGAPPTATMPTGGAGPHQFHRCQLRGRRRLAPVDGSRLSAPAAISREAGYSAPVGTREAVPVTSAYRRLGGSGRPAAVIGSVRVMCQGSCGAVPPVPDDCGVIQSGSIPSASPVKRQRGT
jgi:hypothetical protein